MLENILHCHCITIFCCSSPSRGHLSFNYISKHICFIFWRFRYVLCEVTDCHTYRTCIVRFRSADVLVPVLACQDRVLRVLQVINIFTMFFSDLAKTNTSVELDYYTLQKLKIINRTMKNSYEQ